MLYVYSACIEYYSFTDAVIDVGNSHHASSIYLACSLLSSSNLFRVNSNSTLLESLKLTEIHTHAWIPRLHMYIWYGGYIVVGLVPRLPWMDL